ncbi:unnamed protein product [Rotaria sp. Silwood1]|nr:unnamed protein product [Rotaria sp. Silwood1]CAF1224864.1 unnamed protein product [Rotaria sp. Silwood1]CAF3477428.1 unnamed protein product [Rotaria sp. Silwood1]CAF3489515.1 unnamed protein product [Rotaria sp. Silwood1]CAF4827503.1 unnamed protein product [Rotaria sp. Silwood1]
MSMQKLNKELAKLLNERHLESSLTERLDNLIKRYGVIQIEAWRNMSDGTKNTLLHELVCRQCLDIIRYIVPKFNLNVSITRETDKMTPFELAHSLQDWKMCNLLLELGDDKTSTNTYDQYAMKKQKDKMMNIVWIDLEFTSFDNPEVLECAVIITDKDLNELERKAWVVHFEKEILDELGEWHQNAFKDHNDGGNGLFTDVITSNITKEQMEQELLDLIKRHCPEKACPLAGSSIHIDREVMKTQMPTVYNYLHYRVIDVSSFREMMKRWAPSTASRFVREIAANGKCEVTHRAMDDIEWSIELMKMFRPLLTARKNTANESNTSDRNRGTFERSIIQKNKLPIIISHIDRSKLYSDEKQLIKRLNHEQNFDVYSLKLNNNDQRLYDQNPHLREVFINGEKLLIYNEEFTDKNRLLDLSSNEFNTKKSNVGELDTTEYWGQRKLLLSEIEFLTSYATDDNCLVVYVGAAPGAHLDYLSSLFPTLEFVLIDIQPFVTFKSDKIKIQSECFTEDLAKTFSKENKSILFICDIHTFSNHDNLKEDIHIDISNQIIWCSTIDPHASLLTFRLPNAPGTILFFEGHLLLDTWTSRKSMECRLIVEKNAQMKTYDHGDFERAMNNFQNITRTMYYTHAFDTVETEGLDNCYDCRSEIFILEKYLHKIKTCTDESELKRKIAELSYDISRNIGEKNR